MRCLEAALWLGLGLGGCGGSPAPEVPADDAPVEASEPEVRVIVPDATHLEAPRLAVDLHDLRAVSHTGGWTLTASLLLTHRDSMTFDGLVTKGRSVLLDPDAFTLMADDVPLVPTAVEHITESPAEDKVFVSTLPPRQAVVRLSWELTDLPETLALEVVTDVGRGMGWWLGKPTAVDGPMRAIQPVDLGGRALAVPGTVVSEGRETAVAADGWPLVWPLGEATVTLDGFAPRVLSLSEDDAAVVVTPMVPNGAPLEGAFAAIWDALPASPPPPSLASLSTRFRTVAEVVTFVRDEIGILHTRGITRSPDAVLRLGAGSPLERALLARDVLGRMGFDTRFSCTDLPADEVAELYDDAVAPPEVPEVLRGWVDDLKAKRDALAGDLEASWVAWDDKPTGRVAQVSLVPEWCWVGVRPLGSDGAFEAYDLRPGSDAQVPAEFVWRTTPRIKPELWRYAFSLMAAQSGDDGAGPVRMVSREATGLGLTDGSLAIEFYPAPTAGVRRAHLSYVIPDETSGRTGTDVLAARTEGLSLLVGIADPRAVTPRSRELPLWERISGKPLPVLVRVVVDVDPGVRDFGDVQRVLARAVSGAGPTPELAAHQAQHALWSWLRLVLNEGRVPADPIVNVSAWITHADGRVTVQTFGLPGSVPQDGGTDPKVLTTFAATDAVIRAALVGEAVPAVPTFWMADSDDLGLYATRDTSIQVSVARRLSRVGFGADKRGELWTVDRDGVSLQWTHAFATEVPGTTLPLPKVTPAARVPYEAWSTPVRCMEARRWAPWVGLDVPDACVFQGQDAP